MHMQFYEGSRLSEYLTYDYDIEEKDSKISKSDEMLSELLNDAEIADSLIQLRKKLTDEEFINILEKVAIVQIGISDILRICTKLNGCNCQYYMISTTTKFDLDIIATDEFEYKYNHYYTLSEINELVENGKIIIIRQREQIKGVYLPNSDGGSIIPKWTSEDKENRTEECNTFNPIFAKEKDIININGFEPGIVDEYFYNLDYEFVIPRDIAKKSGVFYKYLIKDIRKNAASNYRLREELEQFIGAINSGVNQVKKYIDRAYMIGEQTIKVDTEGEIAKEILDNFTKKGYVRRLEKIKEKYPNYHVVKWYDKENVYYK